MVSLLLALLTNGTPSDAAPAPPTPTGPTHSFQIRAAQGGYNLPLGRGSIVNGTSSTYDTPGGKSVTVVHCRLVGTELNFALSGTSLEVSDFPTRIVLTKLTGGEVEREAEPQARSFRPISDGRYHRQDYDPTGSPLADALVNGQTIRVDLYYS